MPGQPVERKLAAIFAADIAGYSRLMAGDEIGTLGRLKACRAIIDELIAAHRGRIFNTAGDSVVADFASAVDAVQCAVAVQAAITTESAKQPADEPMQFRIGVHVGDIMVDGENLLGDGVNIAARLEALAEPGAIYISAMARDHIGNKLPLAFDDLGEQQVKNIAQALRVYRVQTETAAPPSVAALPLPDKPSIAVLPFANLSGDLEQEYFADGIVEEIIVGLSRMRWLFVIARNSSFTYKGQAVDVRQVGRELGVRYVLEGSVRKGGNRVRITAQLVDASTSAHVWAERFEGSLDDIFELQDQVTASVLGELGPNLERAEIERAKRKPTESLDAYDYYLRGTACAHRGTREGVAEALRLLSRAIEIDPDFAAPHGLAAFCHLIRQFNGWTDDRTQDVAEVKRLAWRAAEIGKDDSVALSFGGLALGYFAGDLENGAALIDRALVLNPNLAFAWYASGLVRSLRGDEPELAIEEISKAIRLNPLDPFMYTIQAAMALAHFFNGTYDEASSWAAKALRENPRNPGALRILAASNALAGRLEGAHEAMARALEVDPAMRVANLDDRIGGFRPSAAAKYADALRKAGLPD